MKFRCNEKFCGTSRSSAFEMSRNLSSRQRSLLPYEIQFSLSAANAELYHPVYIYIYIGAGM